MSGVSRLHLEEASRKTPSVLVATDRRGSNNSPSCRERSDVSINM